MIRRLLKFLGWIDRQPGDLPPFPFAALEHHGRGVGWTGGYPCLHGRYDHVRDGRRCPDCGMLMYDPGD